MTELRPGTPNGSSGNAVATAVSASSPGDTGIQLQGFSSRASAYSYSYSRPFQDRDGMASLHSEPDIDTIMPLPGAVPQGQLQNVVSPGASADEYGSLSSYSEEGEGEEEGEGPRRPLLERVSASDFSAIEVQVG